MIRSNENALDGNSLLELLPPKKIADELVQLYIGTIESTHRILHVPKFREEYLSFWEDRQNTKPTTVVLILLVMAAVSSVPKNDPVGYLGESSPGWQRAARWIDACDLWVQNPNNRHKDSGPILFQIHCLSHVAKQMNHHHEKQAWTSAGALMRMAISSGLHRELHDTHRKTSEFDREIRRRLWATISELELQACVERGMPLSFPHLEIDCSPPLNINDEDLLEFAEHRPVPKPLEVQTDASFQVLLQMSLPLRLKIAARMNVTKSAMTYEEVLILDAEINRSLEIYSRYCGAGIPGLDLESATFWKLNLDLQLRQFLLFLHRPYAIRSKDSSRFTYSRKICLDTATTIIRSHSKFIESGDDFSLCLFREDIANAALAVCCDISLSSFDQQISTGLESTLSAIHNSASQKLVDRALEMMEIRLDQADKEFKQYGFLCMVFGLVKGRLEPQLSDAHRQESIDRVAQRVKRLISSQKFGTNLESETAVVSHCLF